MVPNSSLENAFRTHLASALGYYHHLLCRLQSEFDLSIAMCVDFYYVPESKTRKHCLTISQMYAIRAIKLAWEQLYKYIFNQYWKLLKHPVAITHVNVAVQCFCC